ncbi:MAG TPA: hypothetical protein VFX47_05085 [Gammaproteobacteria bacterium]|nr:hypothetical protein [Gammaproteobacteria bacterium]
MPSEMLNFQHEFGTFRIQFEIIAPPPAAVRPKNAIKTYSPPPKFRVNGIRITEVVEEAGEGRKKTLQYGRDFESLAQARSQAGEYAKRIVREQMGPPKPVGI